MTAEMTEHEKVEAEWNKIQVLDEFFSVARKQ